MQIKIETQLRKMETLYGDTTEQDGDANDKYTKQDLGANEQNADQDGDANGQVPKEQDVGANE